MTKLKTEAWRKYFDPSTVDRLAGLRLASPVRAEGYLTGRHRSPRIGGIGEFSEHREYVPGDDLRLVDWKVYGRSDRYYLKQREDEANLVCHVLLDCTGSMGYGGAAAGRTKLDAARRLAAALALVAIEGQDLVSLAALGAAPPLIRLQPGGGHGQLMAVADALDRLQPGSEVSLASDIEALAERLTPRGLVVVLSDLLDDPERIEAALRHLRGIGHDVLLLQTLDPDELDFPDASPVRLVGLEGEPALEVDPPTIRRAYRSEVERFLKAIGGICRALGVQHALLTTDRPVAESLAPVLAERMQQSAVAR